MGGPTPSITYAVDGPNAAPAQGDVLYYDGSKWGKLAPGTAGQALLSGGAGANPSWGSAGVTDHGGLTGLGDDDHTQYVYLTPGASARNVIQPSGNFVPLTVQGHATQAVNLQEWKNSAGTVVVSLRYDGYTVFGGAGQVDMTTLSLANAGAIYWGGSAGLTRNSSTGAMTWAFQAVAAGGLTMVAGGATTIPLTVKGAASQSANLQEWKNSAGTALANVSASGVIFGQQYLIAGNGDKLQVDGNGVNVYSGYTPILYIKGAATGPTALTVNQTISTSGSPTLLKLNGSAHTTLAASTEAIDAYFNLSRTVQFATGALATQRAVVITPPTYGFVGASTITTAATLDVTGAPVAGTNATITNRFALRVQDPVLIQPGTYASKGLVIRQAADMTAAYAGNMLDIQNVSGTSLLYVRSYNTATHTEVMFGAGPNSVNFGGSSLAFGPSGYTTLTLGGTGGSAVAVTAQPMQATNIGLLVKGAAAQTANLQEWQNSAGTVLAKVDASGYPTFGSASQFVFAASYCTLTPVVHCGANIYSVSDQDTGFGWAYTTEWEARMIHSGSAVLRVGSAKMGFFNTTPVAKAAALTAADAGALNTGDATSDTVIGNIRTRLGELETRLQAYGLLT